MKTTLVEPETDGPRVGWFADFPCGCPSPIVAFKEHVPLTCSGHGRVARVVVSIHPTRHNTALCRSGLFYERLDGPARFELVVQWQVGGTWYTMKPLRFPTEEAAALAMERHQAERPERRYQVRPID